MQRKPTFFTSDWHRGHPACIEFDQRPFRNTDHMHEYLIRNYNSTVPDNGICYFLGDMGMGSAEANQEFISQLKGTKVLVLGNHDRNPNAMYSIGYDVVMYGAVLYIQGERVTLSHCPLRNVPREDLSHIAAEKRRGINWHGEFKNEKYTFRDEGQFHLHGHIHSRKDTPGKLPILGKQMDVGVPANNYRPVSISQVESWIARYKQENNG